MHMQLVQKKLKLKLVQGDDDAYDRLIEKIQPISDNNITINYNYFVDEVLKKSTPEKIKKLYDAIMKLVIVNISLQPHNGDDPQLIFESLNSTGLGLEESDKIRNFVLMKLDSAKQERIYKNYWEKLENKVSKIDINRFIRYYLAVKTRELANESNIYFAFKNFRDKQDCHIEDILSDMLYYADFYKNIRAAKVGDHSFLGCIARINKLEINTVIPLLFDLYNAKNNGLLTENEMYEAVKVLETYIARRIICALPASALNKIFVSLGAEIQRYIEKYGTTYLDALKYAVLCKTGKSRFPNDRDFAEKFITFELYNIKPAARKYILERLENFNNRERVAVEEQIDSGDFTIEHIMPQILSEEWKKQLGNNWELIHTKYIDTVGNLTLTAYNSDYSNLAFAKKKTMPDKGFNFSKLALNSYIKTCEEWGEKQITDRANKLYEWAIKIWAMPSTNFAPTITEEWVYLDDDIDFTNKNIIKISLLGDDIITDNITDAYKKVNATIYMLDPVKFASIENNYYRKNAADLRSPYELSSTMFIETNLSSQHKINIIRDLFAWFKIDYQELKFLLKPQKETAKLSLNDESTYFSVTCGELAYAMFKSLLLENKISNNDIALLMSKEYTRTTFTHVNYPVLALSRDANRGDSRTYRYYKTPVTNNGINYYISSQWFDESREDLIKYFNSKK